MTPKKLHSLIEILKNDGLSCEDLDKLTPEEFKEHANRFFGKTLYDALYGDPQKLPLYISSGGWKGAIARWRMK